MLMKLMLGCNGDFDKVLRRRRLLGFALLVLGLTAIACYFLFVDKSQTLPDFARGFYLGAGSGACLGSAVLLARTQYLLSHPEARKKAQIQETDERERAIIAQSFQFAGLFTFFLSTAAMLVLVAVSAAAARTVFAVIAAYALAWVCANAYLSKKL